MSNQAERNSVVQHTPGSLSFASTRDQSTYALFDSSDRTMAMFLVGGVFSTQDQIMQQHRQNKVDARRIVACWNTCIGISTEVLELNATAGGVAELERQRDEARAQRDELLAALEGVLAIVGDSGGVAGYHLNGDIADWGEFDEINAVYAVIAKAKGEHHFDTQLHGKTIAELKGDGHLGGDA